MAQFHDTGIGKKFLERDLPHLCRSMEKIADALEEINERNRIAEESFDYCVEHEDSPKNTIIKLNTGVAVDTKELIYYIEFDQELTPDEYTVIKQHLSSEFVELQMQISENIGDAIERALYSIGYSIKFITNVYDFEIQL